MRTNIEIDGDLMAAAQRLSGQPTKKATVEKALRLLVDLKRQQDLHQLFGTVERSGDLDQSRLGRSTN